MKKLVKYSYLILLVVSCMIAVGFKFVTDSRQTEDDSQIKTDSQTPGEQTQDGQTHEPINVLDFYKNDSSQQDGTDDVSSDNDGTDNPLDGPSYPDSPEFISVDESYFDDALFIGDSRTVGLYEYGPLDNATYFAITSMTVYEVRSEYVYVSGVGTVSLSELLGSRSFGKIYVMLGINELGYGMDDTIDKYAEFIDYLKQAQPDAIIYVEANMHVTAERSNNDSIYNNTRIDYLNNGFAQNADNERVFYIDMNVLFDDGYGNLDSQYSGDNTHLLGKYYAQWGQWLCENAVVTPGMNYTPKVQQPDDAPADSVDISGGTPEDAGSQTAEE